MVDDLMMCRHTVTGHLASYTICTFYLIDQMLCPKSQRFARKAMKEKIAESCFDVTMESFDGAEVCELVGIHILSLLSNKLDKQYTGLCRDDGLVVLRNTSKQKTDRIRKDIIEIFNFKIEIKTNLHIADILDIILDLLDVT